MQYDSKFEIASYHLRAEEVVATRMLPCKTMFFEGPSDSRFYEGLYGVRCRHMGEFIRGNGASMKTALLDCYRLHMKKDQTIDKNGDCYYCVDRDFDEVLGVEKDSNSENRLFYQLAKTGRAGGFNDLENMLIKSPLFEHLMYKEYRMSPERTQQVVKNVQDVASFLGCFRVANRYMKVGRVGDILYQVEYGRQCEVGVSLLFSSGGAKAEKGKIVLDEERFARALRNLCGSNNRLVEETIKYAMELRAKVKRTCNFQDYCRGHDLTDILCVLLRSRDGYPKPLDSAALEKQMRRLPYDDSRVLDECLAFIGKFELGREIGQWKKSKF